QDRRRGVRGGGARRPEPTPARALVRVPADGARGRARGAPPRRGGGLLPLQLLPHRDDDLGERPLAGRDGAAGAARPVPPAGTVGGRVRAPGMTHPWTSLRCEIVMTSTSTAPSSMRQMTR